MVEKVSVPKKDWLPAPTECPCCHSKAVRLTTHEVLYGKTFGDWPVIYYCDNCRASVSCHKGTNIPMGYMADQENKTARSVLHKVFDPLWKTQKYSSRTSMYKWLAEVLGIAYSDCHISRLDTEQCHTATKHCKALDRFMKSNKKVDIYAYLQSI